MDYREELYPKMPFYMTYPVQNMYLTEMEYEKDMDRIKSYYPNEAKAVMKLVEERLDELEYEGSRIYDEEPDRLMIQMEVDQLYKKLMENPEFMERSVSMSKADVKPSYFEMVPLAVREEKNLKAQGRGCENNWLCSMVGVLFGTELYKRRCHHRRCRRWF